MAIRNGVRKAEGRLIARIERLPDLGGNCGKSALSGERKFDEPTAGVEYHQAERVSGKFSRNFYVPQAIKQDDIKATYQDGILEIHDGQRLNESTLRVIARC